MLSNIIQIWVTYEPMILFIFRAPNVRYTPLVPLLFWPWLYSPNYMAHANPSKLMPAQQHSKSFPSVSRLFLGLKKGSCFKGADFFFHFKIQTYRKAIEIVERIPVYSSSRFVQLTLYYICFLILSLSLCILFIRGILVLWIATNTELANTKFLEKYKVGFP